MYRKSVWYGTILAKDIKGIFQLVLENWNITLNRSSGICTMLYKKRRDILMTLVTTFKFIS